ncbi:hypothetical protein FQR65_LT02915 [Abscondita terminalis]|nr:hypothetical protein FQR65_LT02915 [Abscondita terminalis]
MVVNVIIILCVCTLSVSPSDDIVSEKIHSLAVEAASDATNALHQQHVLGMHADYQAKLVLADVAADEANVAQATYYKKLAHIEELGKRLRQATITARRRKKDLRLARYNLDAAFTTLRGVHRQLHALKKAAEQSSRINSSTSKTVIRLKEPNPNQI